MQLTTRPTGSSELPTSEIPFTLKDLKDAIPDYCFEPSTGRSLAYFFLDIGIIAGLYGIAYSLNSWLFFPLFWLMQGTMFWALFVVGHDCGHRSFSKHKWLNNLIGHLSHTPILVPFHGWRISHRTHHANTGNIDTDESWYPISEKDYNEMDAIGRAIRFNLFLLAYPFYLFKRSPGRKGSHFMPGSDLFRSSEKWDVLTSTALWTLFVGFLGWIGFQFGIVFLLKFYVMPYLVFVVWLDLVTFLHHTEPDIPWYRNDSWYFLKGALSTIDRDYGFINSIHHNIGTHVAHHIFLNMPHYHLKDATEAIKPILGDYYREAKDSIWTSFWRSARECIFVPNEGQKVYYQPRR
ncbi:fatty acid desaturase [Leptolyngbya sp. Heron Island J]|uniref:fatty acid desaturase n=1 Tax=Leptolyngbya sp. Heron Island J TaxID=1385935 RepID=UPI0003B9FA8C|nr:fatty acid desaturase [Leptolyngbya sp. Heron Island J]ESA35905.1 fatty acid desaturase [Leptolyngbya sp. Heron Island J]